MQRPLPSKPGWYPDPAGQGRMRYWDGSLWADRYRQRPPWASHQADFGSPVGYDRVAEGPVHPHQLREPVTSGVASRHGQFGWRAWPAHRPWHRGPGYPLDDDGPVLVASRSRFGPARRPLALFASLVVVAVAVVVSSFAVMAPYQTDGTSRFAKQPAEARFESSAGKQCASTLPKYAPVLLTSYDGPSILAASRQVDQLRSRLYGLHPAAAIKGPVQAWLDDWRKLAQLQRRYAVIVGPAVHREGKVVPRRLSAASEARAMAVHRLAMDEAHRADQLASNLDIAACTLLQPVTT